MTRCSACDTEVEDWKNHIKTPIHIKNVKKQRQKENVCFDKDCPLCTIPYNEPLLFENELVYLVPTKDSKGHKVRIMSVIKRHSKHPTFEEKGFAYACIINYMSVHTKKFFLAAPKKPSIPDHWHLVACDNKFSTLDEKESLFTNPYIELPLSQQQILIGIPAHNEKNTIQKIITEAKKYGSVVIVNDGSTNGTKDTIKESNVNLVTHKKRLGYGKSIHDIFKYAKQKNFDILVTLDADGQHNPDEIPKFLKAINLFDIVVGNRFMSDSDIPKYRKFGIKTISKLSGIDDAQCGFRAYNKKAISIITDKLYEKGMGSSIEILKVAQLNNLKISEIPCTIHYNKKSHTQNPLSHGIDVLRSLFWTIIWENPTKTLFPLGLIFLIISMIAGLQTINLYLQFHLIVISWALLTIGAMICGTLILNIFTFIFVFKNKRMEM